MRLGFHKDVAWKAYTSGKTSKDFEAASHKHGSAFWFYLAIAALVWWRVGWHWALLPLAATVYTAYNAVAASFVAHHIQQFEQAAEEHNKVHPPGNLQDTFEEDVQRHAAVLEATAKGARR